MYYSKQLRKKHAASAADDVSDSDTATIGASDADAESDTETEDYEQGKTMLVVVTRLVGVAACFAYACKMQMFLLQLPELALVAGDNR